MTKERLEELIKQGATIYPMNRAEIDLSETSNFIENELCIQFTIDNGWLYKKGSDHWIPLNKWEIGKLFETKEQAEWALKTTAERTERFEPPMWKDLVTPYHFTFIVRSEKDSSDLGTYALYVYQSGIMIEEDIESHHKQHYLFDKDFTKENYEKACEIVRDLFRGANNGQQ